VDEGGRIAFERGCVVFCGDLRMGNRVSWWRGDEGMRRFPRSCNNCRPGVLIGKRAGVLAGLVGEGVPFRAESCEFAHHETGVSLTSFVSTDGGRFVLRFLPLSANIISNSRCSCREVNIPFTDSSRDVQRFVLLIFPLQSSKACLNVSIVLIAKLPHRNRSDRLWQPEYECLLMILETR
jgi:hypothetical protein